MYTWGYLKDAILAKLDLSESEAQNLNLMCRFPIFANEAMTQICSSIKPKYASISVRVYEDEIIEDDTYDYKVLVGYKFEMPKDFISFRTNRTVFEYTNSYGQTIIIDDIENNTYLTYEYGSLKFLRDGLYTVSYNARWLYFDKTFTNNVVLNAPADVLDCIPSYVVSQCYKVDDEVKSSIYRNEYEMFLARVDASDGADSTSIKINGGW